MLERGSLLHGTSTERSSLPFYGRRGIQHLLSLPIFIFLRNDVIRGFKSLSTDPSESTISLPYMFLAMNLLTQVVCVSGVNKLTSVRGKHAPDHPTSFLISNTHQATSAVSTSVVLTVRKALSLCLSIWYFGSDWNYSLVFGAGMVFVGSLTYSTASSPVPVVTEEK